MKTVHLLVKGKVQGVFFRASAKDKADELGVTGWVKNTDEGHVELMATGDEEKVNLLTKWCWEGPRRAQVTEVEVKELTLEVFSDFTVIRRQ